MSNQPQCNAETCEIPTQTQTPIPISSSKSDLRSISDFLPSLSILKGLRLVQLKTESTESKEKLESSTLSESLWKDKACLIYLVRRPGCILCRNKAKELMSIKDQLKSKGIGLAAVVHEELGVDEFRNEFWPTEPIYLNSDRSMFAAINDDRKVHKQGLLSGLFSSDMWRRIRQAKDAGVEGNLKGEGRILGGILLMGPGEEGAKWIKTEKSFGNHASNDEILSVIESMKF